MKSLQSVRWLLCLLFAVLPATGWAALQDSYGEWATPDGSINVSVGPAGVTGTCDAGPYHMGCSVTDGSVTATGFDFTVINNFEYETSSTMVVSLTVQGDVASGKVTTTFDGFSFTDPFEMKRTGSPPIVLSLTKSGTGTGTVTSSPAGINCGTTWRGRFQSGTG